mmetsp:Transcript_14774/g.62339  ORF Transcript_14774/g.62339 Transcript_14774/m.62339 type:complete len:245 (+) Transcript_14774:936-1670(+)
MTTRRPRGTARGPRLGARRPTRGPPPITTGTAPPPPGFEPPPRRRRRSRLRRTNPRTTSCLPNPKARCTRRRRRSGARTPSPRLASRARTSTTWPPTWRRSRRPCRRLRRPRRLFRPRRWRVFPPARCARSPRRTTASARAGSRSSVSSRRCSRATRTSTKSRSPRWARTCVGSGRARRDAARTRGRGQWRRRRSWRATRSSRSSRRTCARPRRALWRAACTPGSPRSAPSSPETTRMCFATPR